MANTQQRNIAGENAAARGLILQSAVNMWQQIFTQNYTTGNILGAVINVNPRNVGLVKRFVVRIDMTFARSAAETHTLTDLGVANVISNIVLTDLSNNQRINTAGWHLFMLSSIRRQLGRGYGPGYGIVFTPVTYPVDLANNYTVQSAPTSFTTGSQTLRVFFEVPLAYSDFELWGSVYANVVNATWNLQITINPNFSVVSTADDTLAVYKSSSTDLAVPSAMTVKVYQNYLDQLPQGPRGPILPQLDLSTAYLLNNTSLTGMTAGQEFTAPYANFRDFLSTIVIYDQAGTRAAGTDINYFALRSANFTNIWQYDPIFATLLARNMMLTDPITGMYVFDQRSQPINTSNYGNMELVMSPITAAAGSQLLVGYEQRAIMNYVAQAGSLANAGG